MRVWVCVFFKWASKHNNYFPHDIVICNYGYHLGFNGFQKWKLLKRLETPGWTGRVDNAKVVCVCVCGCGCTEQCKRAIGRELVRFRRPSLCNRRRDEVRGYRLIAKSNVSASTGFFQLELLKGSLHIPTSPTAVRRVWTLEGASPFSTFTAWCTQRNLIVTWK